MNNEREPNKIYAFSLEIGEQQFICTRDNTFGYLYENPDYDYVFIKTNEDEDTVYGYRIYRHLMEDQFDKMIKKMIKNDFTVYSEDKPDEEDLIAYRNSLPQEFKVPYPDTEWGNTRQLKTENWGKFLAHIMEKIANKELEDY